MSLPSVLSEQHIADAFNALFDYVVALPLGSAGLDAPIFSFLLTPKQKFEIDKVCTENKWPMINCIGILIDLVAIRHPLGTRRAKDGITNDEIKRIIATAYSPRSIVRANRNHGQQALMLNNQRKVPIGKGGTVFFGMAVLEIKTDGARNYLTPVTCYHANEAKSRAISR
jgi:hypothetical protein